MQSAFSPVTALISTGLQSLPQIKAAALCKQLCILSFLFQLQSHLLISEFIQLCSLHNLFVHMAALRLVLVL